VKRVVCAWLLLAAVVLAAAAPVVAQQPPRPPAAQDEYVPVRDLPGAEQLPAAPLVIASYAFIWVAAMGYVWFTWRRLGAVEREIAHLRREIETTAAPER
jgi:CcmD family protein